MQRCISFCFVLLTYILLHVLWASWICGLGKFSVIIVSNISLLPFPLLFKYSHYVYVAHFIVVSQSLDILSYIHLCSLNFLIFENSVDTSSRPEFLSSAVSSLLISPSKDFFLLRQFWSLAFLFGSFLEFPCFCSHRPSVLACCLL